MYAMDSWEYVRGNTQKYNNRQWWLMGSFRERCCGDEKEPYFGRFYFKNPCPYYRLPVRFQTSVCKAKCLFKYLAVLDMALRDSLIEEEDTGPCLGSVCSFLPFRRVSLCSGPSAASLSSPFSCFPSLPSTREKSYCFLTADWRTLTQLPPQGMELGGTIQNKFLT